MALDVPAVNVQGLVVPVDGTDSTSVATAVNRDAAAAGVTLSRLETATASLEDRYLAMIEAIDKGGEG